MYYLPCACGLKHKVETAQAGQTLTCECGRALEIPSLRGLRQLEPVEVAPSRYLEPARTAGRARPAPGAKPTWTSWQAALFAVGVLALLAGSAAAIAALVVRSGFDSNRPTELLEPTADYALIDAWPPAMVYEEWKKQATVKQLPWVVPAWVQGRQAQRLWALRALLAGGLALGGAAFITVALLTRARPGEKSLPARGRG